MKMTSEMKMTLVLVVNVSNFMCVLSAKYICQFRNKNTKISSNLVFAFEKQIENWSTNVAIIHF